MSSRSKISMLLNDSDESVFQSPTVKRKRLPSPTKKRQKLSQSTLTKTVKKQAVTSTPAPDSSKTLPDNQFLVCEMCGLRLTGETHYTTHQKRCAKKMQSMALKESIETQNQMALATAISLSLIETPSIPNCTNVDKAVYNAQKATLETFGFTSSTAAKVRRKKINRFSVLKSRTEDDRQRLISEKSAIVIQLSDTFRAMQSYSSVETTDSVPLLWRLAESQDSLLLSSPSQTDQTPKINSSIPSPSSQTLAEDLEQLVGNPQWSDAVLLASDGSVPVHKAILGARCPLLALNDFQTEKLKISSKSLKSILRYLYTGKLESIERSMIQECIHFASSTLCRSDLVDLLKIQEMTVADELKDLDEADTVPVSHDGEESQSESLSLKNASIVSLCDYNILDEFDDIQTEPATSPDVLFEPSDTQACTAFPDEVITLSSDEETDRAINLSRSFLETPAKSRKRRRTSEDTGKRNVVHIPMTDLESEEIPDPTHEVNENAMLSHTYGLFDGPLATGLKEDPEGSLSPPPCGWDDKSCCSPDVCFL